MNISKINRINGMQNKNMKDSDPISKFNENDHIKGTNTKVIIEMTNFNI